MNGNVERWHKGTLRKLCNDYEFTFEFLLAKNDDTNIHLKNLLLLMFEIGGVELFGSGAQSPWISFSFWRALVPLVFLNKH